MQYRRCKCGKSERWDTGEAVKPCQGCSECGTTYAQGPGGHEPLEPHKLIPQYDTDTGLKKGTRCTECNRYFRD